MKPGAHIVVAAAARFYTPLIALFACTVLVGAAPGGGVGFVAGLAFGLALLLHALVFGAVAARAAFPPALARALLALGVAAAVASAGLHGLRYAPQIVEAGLFVATVAGAAIVIHVVFGRASALLDQDWR
ncbi:MAG: MnhB domain-containing protein [Caulobacteraceae bacterium]